VVGASTTGNGGGGGGGAALSMAELAELGGDIPDGEARVGVKDGIDVPPLEATCYCH